MKIAFVGQPFDYYEPPVQGGSVTIWTYQVAQRLAQKHDVTIYGRLGAGQRTVETIDGVRYRRIPALADDNIQRMMKLPGRLLDYPFPKKPYYANPFYYRNYVSRAAAMMAADQTEVIHLSNFSQQIPLVRRINPQAHIAIHMHCEWLTQLDQAMIDSYLQHADLLLGCSDYITEQICRRFPHYAARCKTIVNGVNEAYLAYKPNAQANGVHCPSPQRQDATGDPIQLLFVGRISPEKGVHILLDAMPKIVAAYPNVLLNLVGPPGDLPYDYIVGVSDDEKVKGLATFYTGRWRKGDYYPKLLKLAQQVPENVAFHGQVRHSQIQNYYQHADILINPSLSESFGMSLIEAMAHGVPVVAARVGGMCDVVQEGVNGLLTEAGNSDALADAVIALITDREQRRTMARSGREWVEQHYTWNKVTAQLEALYLGSFTNTLGEVDGSASGGPQYTSGLVSV